MDLYDYATEIMFYIFKDQALINKIKDSNILSTNLILDVQLKKEENDTHFYINMYRKENKNTYLKKNLPKYKKVTSNDVTQDCSICLESYKENTYKRMLHCNHNFHKKCIDKWLKKCSEDNIHCPICRNQYTIPLEFISNFSIQKTI